MPAYLKTIVERIYADRDLCGEASALEVEAIIRATIEQLGMHVDAKGEVCDPRPNPAYMPKQQNVHWTGGRRRRQARFR
jgi:hypothetical protein